MAAPLSSPSQLHQPKQQQWGISAPISSACPSPLELQQTEELLKTLHDNGLFESEQEAEKR